MLSCLQICRRQFLIGVRQSAFRLCLGHALALSKSCLHNLSLTKRGDIDIWIVIWIIPCVYGGLAELFKEHFEV